MHRIEFSYYIPRCRNVFFLQNIIFSEGIYILRERFSLSGMETNGKTGTFDPIGHYAPGFMEQSGRTVAISGFFGKTLGRPPLFWKSVVLVSGLQNDDRNYPINPIRPIVSDRQLNITMCDVVSHGAWFKRRIFSFLPAKNGIMRCGD